MVNSSKSVRNLGVFLDQTMSMDKHVSRVCRAYYMHIHQIGRIRKKGASCIHCHIQVELRKRCSDRHIWQSHKTAEDTKLGSKTNRWDQKITAHHTIIYGLHWLPVKYKILYKVLNQVCKG